MIVTAILGVRNEATYLGACLRHLVRNGVRFAIIDHGSTDASAAIYAAPEFAEHLVMVQDAPFYGVYSLEEQLRHKARIIEEIESDWVIHLDADEMMHSYREGESLAEALKRFDDQGWNAANFDEFVFLPVDQPYSVGQCGYPAVDHYYFFEPTSPRLMRAWRKSSGLSAVEMGGHSLVGDNLRLAPDHLALRHYMVLSQEHAFAKYTGRTFADPELARGWHRHRVLQPRDAFTFPPAAALKRLEQLDSRDLDRRDPWSRHFWQWDGLVA
jgi:glycosyltransferase involved in cell wall biosynthesis